MTSNSDEGALNMFGPTSLETYSGEAIDLADPDPNRIKLLDIATALGHLCRYAGHVNKFYSVAEHSILVSQLVDILLPEGTAKWDATPLVQAGFMHDFAEAYMGDTIAPMKYLEKSSHMGGMHSSEMTFTEQRLDRAICKRFALQGHLLDDPIVKKADMWALYMEAVKFTNSKGVGWNIPKNIIDLGNDHPSLWMPFGMEPYAARQAFLDRASEIGLKEVVVPSEEAHGRIV